MKKGFGKMIALGMTLIMAMQMAACGSAMTEEQAANYTEAYLSVICTGENTTDTKLDQTVTEELQSQREEMLSTAATEMGLDVSDASEEINTQMAECMDKMMQAASYDVGEATKDEDNFQVSVTVHPINIGESLDLDAITTQVMELAFSGDFDLTDEDALTDAMYELIIEQLSTAMEAPAYADDYEMTMTLEKVDGDVYDISEESASEFGEHIFDVSGLE